MARMGHDIERAALIYQHEVRGADRRITDAIDFEVVPSLVELEVAAPLIIRLP
jgi:hypothetical protein